MDYSGKALMLFDLKQLAANTLMFNDDICYKYFDISAQDLASDLDHNADFDNISCDIVDNEYSVYSPNKNEFIILLQWISDNYQNCDVRNFFKECGIKQSIINKLDFVGESVNKQINKNQLYENIMRNISVEIKKVLNNEERLNEKINLKYYTDNEIFERYNINIFMVNEDFQQNISKYKKGVANAIRKITEKIGDIGGAIVRNVINMAKKTNMRTFVLVLSMLCVFGGQASAEISAGEAEQFMVNCQKLYNKGRSDINKDGRYQFSVQYMFDDHTGVYFTGYGEGTTWEEAEKMAARDAQKRCMNCNDWSYDAIDIQNMDMRTEYIRQENENGQKCCIAIRWFKGK